MLTAPISRPSMFPTQVRHKLTKIRATMQSSSSTTDDLSVHNATSAGHPSAGGDLALPEDARTKTSTLASLASSEETGFRDPLRIPGHKREIYVYRHADAHISAAHINRFGEIVDIFKENLLRDRRMSRPTATMYKLKMCGVNQWAAQPSILICHPLLDKEVGRRILRNLSAGNVKEQYKCCRDDTRPGFEIYLYLSTEFQVLGNPMKVLSICTCRDSKVAQIVSNDKSYPVSTITCGIFFPGDSTIFALTSAHAFEDNDNEKIGGLALSHDDSMSNSGSMDGDGISNHGSSGMEDDYDWDELEAAAAAAAAEGRQKEFPNDSENSGTLDTSDERHISCSEIKPGKVLGRPNDPQWARQPNLDWVLVEMPGLGVPNRSSFVEPSGLSESVATVVATPSGLRQGTLSAIPSYIDSSSNSTVLTEIWTVNLAEHEQGRLQKGDSGSPVFDPIENRIYGFVTALNCFGELHVIPLKAALDQIWNMVQPLDSSAKPRIFKMVGQDISTTHDGVKSSRQSPVFRRLLQYWPEGFTVMPDMNPPESTVPPLIDAADEHSIHKASISRIEDKVGSVRSAAVETLGKQRALSDNILEAIAARLEDNAMSVRSAAVETLGKQRALSDNILKAIAARLEDNERSVRSAAVETLGKQANLPDNILEAIAARLEDRDWFVQSAAVERLGKQRALSDNILKAIAARLEDDVGSVRSAAVETLDKQPALSDNILEAIAARLEDRDWFVRDAAVKTLGKQPALSDNILEAIAARLEDDAMSVRSAAVETLGKQPALSDNILEAIAARLEDNAMSVRSAAVKTLGKQATLLDNILKEVLENTKRSPGEGYPDTKIATKNLAI
ncbi:hypothetical protein NX059_012176 [Plenodomus lindquistii]|nr:hypothetical protein NX059_012176 [Plenodomus lindquistii]